jgi:hypothetical protein
VDAGGLAASILVSLIGPTGFGGILLIRQQRAKMRGEARAQNSAADETDAKAEVLLAGEALNLFKEARGDAVSARQEAREERDAAARCRRTLVELWAALDASERHMRRLERELTEAGISAPSRPMDTIPRLPAQE